MRTERLQVLLTPEELEITKREAQARGLSLSTLFRYAVIQMINADNRPDGQKEGKCQK